MIFFHGAMTELCLAALTSFSRMAASIFPWSCCAVRMNSCSFSTKLIWCRSRANRASCAPNVTRCLESLTQDHPMLFQFATCQRIYDDVTLKVKLKKKNWPKLFKTQDRWIGIKPENNCQQRLNKNCSYTTL